MTENQGPTASRELSRGLGSVTSGSCTQQQGRLDVHKTFRAEQTSLEDPPLRGRHSQEDPVLLPNSGQFSLDSTTQC